MKREKWAAFLLSGALVVSMIGTTALADSSMSGSEAVSESVSEEAEDASGENGTETAGEETSSAEDSADSGSEDGNSEAAAEESAEDENSSGENAETGDSFEEGENSEVQEESASRSGADGSSLNILSTEEESGEDDLLTVLSEEETGAETVIDAEGGDLASGSYVLSGDVSLITDLTVPSDAVVTIDLNGHTLTGTGSGSVITVSGDLTIVDSTAVDPVSSSGSESLAGSTAENGDGTYTTYYSVTDYDSSGGLSVTYYSYTSGAVTGGSAETGGGVCIREGGTFTLESGTITGNTAVYAGTVMEGEEAPAYEGGGVYGESGAVFIMKGGAVSGNTADEGAGVDVQGSASASAGAAFSMSGGVIAGNTALDDGGGARIDLCFFEMMGGIIADNTAEGNYGGGVAVIAQGSMALDGGIITDNTAYGTGSSAHYGGGIDLDRSSLTMNSGLITGNYASSAGGGVRLYNSSTFTMSGGTIAGNTATNYGGGVALNNSNPDTASAFEMTGGLIADNEAADATIGCGGGVYVETGSFEMTGGIIRDNTANATFSDTYLYYGGGGVWMYNSTFTMSGEAVITGNYAPCGGGAFLYMCSSTLSGSASITGNEALYGGGVYVYYNYDSSCALSGGSVTDNEATYGGGIYAYYYNEISGVTITGNSADCGGGLYATYNADLDSCTISGNTAANGGGLYLSDKELTMTGCSITGNRAASVSDGDDSSTPAAGFAGGGMYIAGGTLATTASATDESSGNSDSSTSVLSNNLADTSADDLYISSSASADLSGVDNTSVIYLADERGAAIDGWYEDVAAARYYKNGTYKISKISEISSGSEYYLVAAHDFYTVTYYDGYSADEDGSALNGGLGDILYQSDDNVYGAEVPTTDDPTREDYTFLGWELVVEVVEDADSAAESSESNLYSADDIAQMTVTGDMAFEAQWAKTYTVTYEANAEEATGTTTDPNAYLAGDTVTTVENGFELDGYTFTGWNTAADGSGTAYAEGDTFEMPAADVVLYAQWEPVTYTVTYYDGYSADEDGTVLNGGLGAILAQTSDNILGAAVPTTDDPERGGYVFLGWELVEGTAEMENTSVLSAILSFFVIPDYYSADDIADMTVTGDMAFEAQWEKTYTVIYTDGVEGEEVFADQATTGLYSGDDTPAFESADGTDTPSRAGYTFTGWSPEVEETVTGDAVYVAQWSEITYTVTYTDGVDDEEVFSDQVYSGLASGVATPAFESADGTDTPSRAGYTFTGWSPEVEETVTGDAVYVAQWTMNEEDDDDETVEKALYYTVTYTDGVDGEEVFADQVAYGIPSGGATPAFESADGTDTPSRAGYAFTGWLPEVAETVTEDAVYTAQWEPVAYTVTYHANADGATGSVDSQTASYGEFVTVSANGFALTGYTFTGWNILADGTGTAYMPGDDLAVTSDIDLYAQWEPVTYEVTYEANAEEATGTTTDFKAYLAGDTVTTAENGFELDGYTFTGWNTAADGSGTAYAEGDTFEMPAADVVLYAQWENDGKGNIDDGEGADDSENSGDDEETENEKGEILIGGGSQTESSSVNTTGSTGEAAGTDAEEDMEASAEVSGMTQTGDSSSAGFWIILMVIAASAAAGILIRRKRIVR